MRAVGRADFMALQALVSGVYFFNSRNAMEQHGWRCARCRSSRRLEIHHRKYRSHGGTHRVDMSSSSTSQSTLHAAYARAYTQANRGR
jgi:hypothetical protein